MSVGPTRGPVQRPGDDRDFTEIFQRLDDLERATSGSGWRFNIINGEAFPAGWGWVEFNDSIDHEFGELGLALVDRTGQGAFFVSQSGSAGQGSLLLTPDGVILAISGMALVLDRATGTFTLYDSSSNPMLQMTDGDPDVHIKSGGTVVADL